MKFRFLTPFCRFRRHYRFSRDLVALKAGVLFVYTQLLRRRSHRWVLRVNSGCYLSRCFEGSHSHPSRAVAFCVSHYLLEKRCHNRWRRAELYWSIRVTVHISEEHGYTLDMTKFLFWTLLVQWFFLCCDNTQCAW